MGIQSLIVVVVAVVVAEVVVVLGREKWFVYPEV